MKPTRWLTLALVLATPASVALAEDEPKDMPPGETQGQAPSASDIQPDQPRDVDVNVDVDRDEDTRRAEADRPTTEPGTEPRPEDTTMKPEEQDKEKSDQTQAADQAQSADQAKSDQAKADVKAHVVPTIAGIEAADKAAAALYHLSSGEELNRQDAQRTVQLAQQGLNLAYNRTQALGDMKDLSSDARSEVDAAETKLRDARQTLSKLQKKVGTRIKTEDMEQIRDHAQNLHTNLSDAEASVDRVAKAYDVSTDLEFGG